MSETSYKSMITKGYKSAIENTPIENDTLRITIDTCQLFADLNDQRIEISDLIKGLTEEEIREIQAPLPKFYYSSDTHKILVYDEDNDNWIVCAEANKDTVENALYATNASTATYANKTLNDANGDQINTTYAPLASPMFTGIPSTPTPATGSNDTQIANTEFVTRAISSAISGNSSSSFSVVESFDSLPDPGISNIIYLVRNEETDGEDIYNEYVWINERYELIGTTRIDLSNYFNSIEVNGTGNAITDVSSENGKLVYLKNSSFLTEHPSVTKNSSTATETPNAGDSIEVIDSVTVDNYGHLINYRKKSVTLPNSVSNASTATYATNAGTATYASNAGTTTNASTANYAKNAGTASTATNASTANYSTNAGTASYSTNAGTATNASTANYSTNAGTATYSTNAGTATNASTASCATKWSTARTINGMSVQGDANRINYGTCSTSAGTAAKTVSCTGFSLITGAEITVKFSTTNTASSPTLNVNSTGAKSIYYRGSAITAGFLAANRTYTFRYNGTQWDLVGDVDTTYTPQSLGFGYGTCSTSASTTAKTASLSNYTLVSGGIVAIKFTYAVPASATLNINSKGAKSIYYRGSAITAGIINAGDIATFVYTGSYYYLLSVDNIGNIGSVIDSINRTVV